MTKQNDKKKKRALAVEKLHEVSCEIRCLTTLSDGNYDEIVAGDTATHKDSLSAFVLSLSSVLNRIGLSRGSLRLAETIKALSEMEFFNGAWDERVDKAENELIEAAGRLIEAFEKVDNKHTKANHTNYDEGNFTVGKVTTPD